MEKILAPIKGRLLKYIDYKGFSTEKFCLNANISYSNFKGKAIASEIGGESLAKILTFYDDLNAEWAITGKGDMLKMSSAVSEPQVVYVPNQKITLTPQIITVDNDGNDNIVYVPVKAAAGYLNGYSDQEFIETLPSFNLPGLKDSTYRAFQVSGDSMWPTLENEEMVIGQWVEKLDYIRDNRVHIVVTKNDGVIIKRLLNRLDKYGYIIAKSDAVTNRDLYPNITLQPDDIIEVWYAVWHGGFTFREPGDLWHRQNNNEADITILQKTVNELKTAIFKAGLIK